MNESTQLNDLATYNVNNMIFSPVQEKSILNSTFTYKTIPISTENNDGTMGDLIFKTNKLYSFGVQENKKPNSDELSGYVMPICLWNKRGPSDDEKRWTDMFSAVCEHIKEHLVANKNEIEKWDLEMADLKRLNPLYWKRDKITGKIESGTGPTLYAKLMSSKKDNVHRIKSIFYDSNTAEEINPLDILGKHCEVEAAIKFESIYIGSKISLQIKIYEAVVTLHSNGVKRLLRPAATSVPLAKKPVVQEEKKEKEYEEETDDEDDDGSLVATEEDEEFVEKPSPPRRQVSKRKAVNKK
jgi:hypothetical protein